MKSLPANLNWEEAHNLLVSAIVPRPIAFVSTIGENGVFNVAPFSLFAPLCVKPMILGFNTAFKRDGTKKDTLLNIEFSKDFVVNVVNECIAEQMNETSRNYPSYVDEFQKAGLTPIKADNITSPMVSESPIKLECRLLQILNFGEHPRRSAFIIGEVLVVHIDDDLVINGKIQTSSLKGVGRMGGDFYCRTQDLFQMQNPELFV